MSRRGQGRVRDAGISDIKRRICAGLSAAEDIVHILPVVTGEGDGMVRDLVTGIQPEVEHEGGAGVLHRPKLLRAVLAQNARFDQGIHGVGKVGVDDHVIGGHFPAIGELDPFDHTVFNEEAFHGRVQVNLGTSPASGFSHDLGDPAQAAGRVIDPKRMLNVGDHGKYAGTLPGRHAQVFGLECERQRQVLVAEIPEHDVVELPGQRQVGDRLAHLAGHEVDGAVVRFLQAGKEVFKSRFLAGEEAIVVDGLARETPFDFRLHAVLVVRHEHLFVGKLQAVHRVKAGEVQDA